MIRKKTALPAPKAESFRCVGNTQKKKTAGLSLRPGTGVKTAPAAPAAVCAAEPRTQSSRNSCVCKRLFGRSVRKPLSASLPSGHPSASVPLYPGGGGLCPAQKRFWFRRFLTRGRANIRAELFLLAMAFDLKKLWMKRERGRLQTRVSEKMTA